MLKKTSLALLVALTTALAACGGSGGSGSGGDGGGGGGGGSGGNTNPQVSGPSDSAQDATDDSILAPLRSATAGTPLALVIDCADSVLNENILDIADAYGLGLADPTSLSLTAPDEAAAAATALVENLAGFLLSLSGTAGCTGNPASIASIPTSNPLAGTPLEPLGAQLLPALTMAQQTLGGSGVPTSADFQDVFGQISTAFALGYNALPDEVKNAPVVGGILGSFSGSLTQLSTLASLTSMGAGTSAISTQYATTVTTVLTDLVTQIVPVGDLQTDGASTDLLAQFESAVALLTGGLATNPTGSLPLDPFSAVGFASLDDLIATFTTQLQGDLLGQTGSPLDLALGPITDTINSLLGLGGGGGGCLLLILCL